MTDIHSNIEDQQSAGKPILKIDPLHLDFGAYKPGVPLTRQPKRTLRIHNAGTGVLTGRILTIASWVIVADIEIACSAGQSKDIPVQISTGAPQSYNRQEYHYDGVLLIDTNGGSAQVSGGYQIGKRQQAKNRPIRALLLLILPVLAGLFFLLNSLIERLPAQAALTQTPDHLLYTSGAETVLARVNATEEARLLNAQVDQRPIETAIPTATQEPSAPGRNTLTPWPFEDFIHPEKLVKDYYQAVSNAQYELAWGMLSPDFQQACCAISGNDPFTIYRDWWSLNIDKVEVQSAYLQAWDENPARVLAALSFYYRNGKIEDLIMVHLIAIDAENNRLLIDEVR